MKNNFDTKDNVNSLSFMDTHDTSKLDMYGVFVKKKKDMKQLPDEEFFHLEDDLTQANDLPPFEDVVMSEKNDDMFNFDDYDDIKDSQIEESLSLEEPLPLFSADDIDNLDFSEDNFDFDTSFADTDDTLENDDMLSFLGEDSDDEVFSSLDTEDFLPTDTEEADDYLSDAFEDLALKNEDDFRIDEELDTSPFGESKFEDVEDSFRLSSDSYDDKLDSLDALPEIPPLMHIEHDDAESMQAKGDDAFFNDVEALEHDLLAEPNSESDCLSENAGTHGQDKSTELLMKIAKEIDELKVELSTIKAELAVHSSRLLAENKNTACENQSDSCSMSVSSSGFFSDDDTDETIALTGDELKNIVATSEEAPIHSQDHSDNLNDDSSFNLDVKYINPISEDTGFIDEELVEDDEDDVLHDITAHWSNPSIDTENTDTAVESKSFDTNEDGFNDIPLEQEITVPFFEDAVHSAEVLEDEPIPTIPSFTEELVADIGEHSPEKESGLFLHEETSKLLEQPVSDEEAEIPILSVEDSDDELLLHEEHKAFFEQPTDDEIAALPLEEVDDELLLHEEASTLLEQPVSEEEAEIPILSVEDSDDELLLHEEHKAFFEQPVEDEMAVPHVQEEYPNDELLLHEEDAKPFEQPVSEEVVIPHLSKANTAVEDEQVDNSAAEFQTKKDEKDRTVSMSLELKNEIKSVLAYMDRLLEALPENKIEEFAKSEYFEVYKHLFEELGISD